MLTQDYLKEILDYDPETGIFRWKVSRQGIRIGAEAGNLRKEGYRRIAVNGKSYFAHRLVWLYIHGKFPDNCIDHINGIKDDNRIANLREATNQQNLFNRGKYKNNTSGHKGVSFHKPANKFQAKIRINRKLKHLGYFDSKEEASAAYQKVAKKLQGDYYYYGR